MDGKMRGPNWSNQNYIVLTPKASKGSYWKYGTNHQTKTRHLAYPSKPIEFIGQSIPWESSDLGVSVDQQSPGWLSVEHRSPSWFTKHIVSTYFVYLLGQVYRLSSVCNRLNIKRHNGCKFLITCQITQLVKHTWKKWRKYRLNPPICRHNYLSWSRSWFTDKRGDYCDLIGAILINQSQKISATHNSISSLRLITLTRHNSRKIIFRIFYK